MSDPDAVSQDDFIESLLGDFLDESAQLLDRLNENLLQLDEWVRELDPSRTGRCDEELLNEMFRAAHSLKGLSAMLGLREINTLTHKVENVFDAARKEQLPVDGNVVELVFQAVDRLSALVDALKEPSGEPIEYESIIDSIGDLLRSAGAERKQSTQSDAENLLGGSNAPDVSGLAAGAPPPALAPAEPDQAPSVPTEGVNAPETGPLAPPDGRSPPSGAAPLPEAEPARTGGSHRRLATRRPAADRAAAAPRPPAVTQPKVDHFEGLDDDLQASAKYLGIFIDEAELSLDELTDAMLALETGAGPEAIEKLMVTAHRIKGSAASVGLSRPAKLAHLMEDLLQKLIDSRRSLTPEVADALLMCADGLRHYIEGLRRGNPPSAQFNQLAHELIQASGCMLCGAGAHGPDDAAAAPRAPTRQTPAQASELSCTVGDELRNLVAAAAPDLTQAFAGLVRFQPGLPLAGLKARLIHEKLDRLGKVCYFHPPVETVEETESLGGLEFGLATDQPLEAVLRQLRIAGVQAAAVEPLAGPAEEPAEADAAALGVSGTNRPRASEPPQAGATPRSSAPAEASAKRAASLGQKARSADTGARPNETLRVEVERLDSLMNLAGQLVINKARFARLSDLLKETLAAKQSDQVLSRVFGTLEQMTGHGQRVNEGHAREELERLRVQAGRVQTELETVRRELQQLAHARAAVHHLLETVHQLHRITDGIQQGVMDTRMVPIGPLFARFRRVVRDITRSNGKLINLEIHGEKTELDKRMIDELGDPLIHMVRNAADHGIEPPDVRQAAGKPRCGTIVLDAFHRGNSIVVQVRDDGKGLDPERIKRKAIEKGLAGEAELARMSPSQIYQLIWEPGLSTAEKVTEVSGRGMGMDIVKSKIEAINGTVELDSAPGRGTTLTIKLPLTLAILPSLLVEIAGGIYSLPLESVVEVVKVGPRDIATVHGKYTARIRGRIVSVVPLGEIFSGFCEGRFSGTSAVQEGVLVVIGEGGREISVPVDRVVGEEDVVVKSVAENYRNVSGVAGASILGDGRVSLILDATAMIDMVSRTRAAESIVAGG